jgi:hypothetical protein
MPMQGWRSRRLEGSVHAAPAGSSSDDLDSPRPSSTAKAFPARLRSSPFLDGLWYVCGGVGCLDCLGERHREPVVVFDCLTCLLQVTCCWCSLQSLCRIHGQRRCRWQIEKRRLSHGTACRRIAQRGFRTQPSVRQPLFMCGVTVDLTNSYACSHSGAVFLCCRRRREFVARQAV